MAEKVITLRNGEYLIDEKTNDYTPKDIIFSFPQRAKSSSITLKNFVKITLIFPWAYGESTKVFLNYKDIEIDSMQGGVEQVLSYILTFKNFSKSELDEIIKNINEEENNKSISSLENRIEELKTEKSNLENELIKLKEIKNAAYKIIEYAEILKKAIETTNIV